MIQELLKNRNLPPLGEREEMLNVLLTKEYGRLPDVPWEMSASAPEKMGYNAWTDGLYTVYITIKTALGEHAFPVRESLHTDGKKRPLVILINFRPDFPDRYLPAEELYDEGLDVLTICYKEVTSDDGDFTDGIAKCFFKDGKREKTDCGKIGLWSFAAKRVLDYAETLPGVDLKNVAVAGHSRLGKTALLTAATDTRFSFALDSGSGNSGSALSRGASRESETIKDIVVRFPFWFSETYEACVPRNEPNGFDQHFLLACIAPRHVFVGAHSLDAWADPTGMFLSCAAASPAWEKYGKAGLIAPDRLPENEEAFLEGNVGFYLRDGVHFFSRNTWKKFCEFMKKHLN